MSPYSLLFCIWYPILDTRISFVWTPSPPSVTLILPPWFLKWGGLESSGRRLIYSIEKTKKIDFFFSFGKNKTFSKISVFFWKKSVFEIFSVFLTVWPFLTIFGDLGFCIDFWDFFFKFFFVFFFWIFYFFWIFLRFSIFFLIFPNFRIFWPILTIFWFLGVFMVFQNYFLDFFWFSCIFFFIITFFFISLDFFGIFGIIF